MAPAAPAAPANLLDGLGSLTPSATSPPATTPNTQPLVNNGTGTVCHSIEMPTIMSKPYLLHDYQQQPDTFWTSLYFMHWISLYFAPNIMCTKGAV